jgi:hypothetical protein
MRPSAAQVRELLDYDPKTGCFRWRATRGGRVAGAVAGCKDVASGYVVIRLCGATWGAHRLAVVHVTGEWPTLLVDHINRRRDDNRYANLRQASHSLNVVNSDKVDRARGYERYKGQYRRKVRSGGRWTYEYFATEADAYAWYAKMAKPRRRAVKPAEPGIATTDSTTRAEIRPETLMATGMPNS